MTANYLAILRGKAKDPIVTRDALSELRSRTAASHFPALIRAVRRACPKFVTRHCVIGKPSFSDLGWDASLKPIPVKDEIAFAQAWLSPYASQINSFRELSLRAQQLVLEGEMVQALELIEESITRYGWSFWLAEMKYGLVQLVHGDAGRQAMNQKLIESATPRIAALYAQIFNDRNDGHFSFDNFISKCRDSFPNLNVSSSTKEYLGYRALNQVSVIPDSMSCILANDVLNSLPDYYESLIDTCASVAIHSTEDAARTTIRNCLNTLEMAGFHDHRLSKIRLMLGDTITLRSDATSVGSLRETAKQLLLAGSRIDGNDVVVSDAFSEDISKIFSHGSAADAAIARTIKFGANLRGLDFCAAAASFAASTSNDIFSEPLISPWIMFVSEELSFQELLWMSADRLRHLAISISPMTFPDRARLSALVDAAMGEDAEMVPALDDPNCRLWLAREWVLDGRGLDAQELFSHPSGGQLRPRDRLKIELFIAAQADLPKAFALASRGIVDDARRAFELPLTHLFSHRKWRDFRDIHLVTLGCVAHFAYLATSDSKIRFVCRMACRKFHEILVRESANGLKEWQVLSAEAKEELVFFLRQVWTGENLSMLDVESTQELRKQRLIALQVLLVLDTAEENATIYADEIKNITFQETIWNGLKNIDETRVFVNEAAILRWAQAELREDYERYLSSVQSIAGSAIPDAIVRDYLIEPNSERLLHFLGKDYSTESGILLVGLVNRLRARFLGDPTDGLNCYLSSRIRHGSLKGTILGPLEDAGLIGVRGIDVAENNAPDGTNDQRSTIAAAIDKFNDRVGGLLDEFLQQRVQVRDMEHPKGAVFVPLDTKLAAPLFEDLAKASSFQQFVTACFDMYWIALKDPLSDLAMYISHDLKDRLQTEFDRLIEAADRQKDLGRGLATLCRTLATATKSQCDVVADWFLIGKNTDSQTYSLEEAVEIAISATRRVYRRFVAPVQLSTFSSPVRLTAYGLAVVVDVLYVTFGNAWNRSGMGDEIDRIIVASRFDDTNDILTLKITTPMSDNVFAGLKNGKLDLLRHKYLNDLPIDLIPKEGGSGLAKLAGISRSAKSELVPLPLDFGLTDDREWYVSISIQLYKRGEAFDAYE